METQILNILDFWFPNTSFQDFWFSSEYDTKIKLEYSDLWNQIRTMSAYELIEFVDQSKDKMKMCLGIVIILDQFTRNIMRSDDRTIYGPSDDLCLLFINNMHNKNKIDILIKFINTYPINERIFILLPFRHQRKTEYLDFVMGMINIMDREILTYTDTEYIKTMKNIVLRFRTATIKDYSKVTDTIIHIKNNKKYKQYVHQHIHNQYLSHEDSTKFIFTPLLIKQLLIHVLDDYCIDTYSFKSIHYEDKMDIIVLKQLYQDTLKFLNNHNITNVCISLSGGVDSMVLCLILHALRNEKRIKNLCAVHVDYGNRDVSMYEALFVANWCAYFSIPLITRRIEHMKRNGTTVITENVDRMLYESETRNIRFNLYREAMKLYGVESVMLGHHSDDLSENVMMNVLRGGDVLNLFTMHEYQMIEGVPISRPMLGLPKSEIFSFAHWLEIPYVKDMTPEDCFRGTVRKIIIPALQKIDPMVLSKINKIGESSDRWGNNVNTQIISPIIDSVKKYKYGLCIPFKESYVSLDQEIWKKVMSVIFHKNYIRMISHKNLNTYIRWLKTRNGLVRLSNGHSIMIYNDYLMIIQTCILYRIQGMQDKLFNIDDNTDTNVYFNGWTINIREYTDQTNKTDITDSLTMDNIMNGQFQYIYKTCIHSSENSKLRSVKDDTYKQGVITYSMGHKQSDTKKFFKGIGISQYIPMIHLGICCNKCNNPQIKHNNLFYFFIIIIYQLLSFLNLYKKIEPVTKQIKYLISYSYSSIKT